MKNILNNDIMDASIKTIYHKVKGVNEKLLNDISKILSASNLVVKSCVKIRSHL